MTTYLAVRDKLMGVAKHARKCPIPVMVEAYVAAARMFCTETRWLKMTVEGSTIAGVRTLQADGDDNVEVIGVRAISVLDGSSARALSPVDPTLWNDNERASKPRLFAYIPEGRFALFPTPDAIYPITVSVEVTPKAEAQALPSELFAKWHDKFTAGALEDLLNMPGQTWSNPVLARKYEGILRAAIHNGKADEQRGHNTGTVVARARRLF